MINSASLFPDCSTLANFKAWAQFLSDALTAGGWVLQGDSGQVNWSSIVAVPASGSPVYEIWKSSDALSATCPITLKIEYGQTGSAGPEIHYTVGTNGTDGAGNMTVPHGARCNVAFYSSEDSPTVQYPCFVSASSGRFSFLLFDDGLTGFPHSYYSACFSIARSVDHTGAPTNEYVHVCSFPPTPNVANSQFQQVIHNASNGGVDPLLTGSPLVALTSGVDLSVSGSDSLLSPIFPMIGALGNPTGDIFMSRSPDVADQSVVTLSVYNVAKNFIVWNQQIGWNNNTPGAILLRYE